MANRIELSINLSTVKENVNLYSPQLPASPLPAISIQNNFGGNYNDENSAEIGQPLIGSMAIAITKTNGHLIKNAADSGFLSCSHDLFDSGLGYFNLRETAVLNLTFKAGQAINTIDEVVFTLTGTTAGGAPIAPVTTKIIAKAPIFWGDSPLEKLTTSGDVLTLAGKRLQATRQGDFNFAGSGYPYIAIPQMMSQAGIGFYDIVAGLPLLLYPFNLQNSPTDHSVYDTSAPSVVNVNNGFIDVPMLIYRNTYPISDPSTARIL